jgi:CheY-like chemotaxis protein
MVNRVLFVDDEVSLLHGIKRRLGTQLDLVTACSGDEALAAIQEQGPFAVVVTDMRMPKMDGVQFIQAARAKAPDTVYIMLTGNQDQATAIQALNDGHVFRFLTKPCQSTDIQQAVEAGLQQYWLVTGEKELLHSTFVGAVGVMTDVLEIAQPGIFGRAERIQEIVDLLQTELGLESQWEYKLCARLGLLGFALLPEQDRVEFECALYDGERLETTMLSAAAIGGRLIERIPRLGTLAKIIGMAPDNDCSSFVAQPKTEEEKSRTGAALLRTAILWDYLTRQNLPGGPGRALRALLPMLPGRVVEILSSEETARADLLPVECTLANLAEGMVLYDDVTTSDGVILVRGGRRLTWTIIEKLRHYNTKFVRLCPIRVRSAISAEPVLV